MIDLTNKKYGKLTVIKLTGERGPSVKGRPKFEGCKYGLPQPLAIVIFGKEYKNTYKSVIFQ